MKPNVLIVDDEEQVLNSLRRVFRNEGYNLYFADSGFKALEIMKDTPIDLLLTDQRMPMMTGAQLIKTVKQEWPATIRIIISGYADFEAVLSAINEGEVYRFLTKPWENNQIRSLIRRALEQGKVLKILNHLVEKIRSIDPGHDVKAEFYNDQARVYAQVQDHNRGMNEKQVSCVLKCIFDFFESNDSDISILSSTLIKHLGKLSFTTEVNAGASLTVDMPIEDKNPEQK